MDSSSSNDSTAIDFVAKLFQDEIRSVALVTAEQCARMGGMSVSWWLQQVRNGNAPEPALRGHRCNRWRLTDAQAFWLNAAQTEGA